VLAQWDTILTFLIYPNNLEYASPLSQRPFTSKYKAVHVISERLKYSARPNIISHICIVWLHLELNNYDDEEAVL
jgi:hypothetical protein